MIVICTVVILRCVLGFASTSKDIPDEQVANDYIPRQLVRGERYSQCKNSLLVVRLLVIAVEAFYSDDHSQATKLDSADHTVYLKVFPQSAINGMLYEAMGVIIFYLC